MQQSHAEHRWVRPLFVTAGIVMCLAPGIVALFLLNGRWLASRIFPGDLLSQLRFLHALTVAVAAAGVVSLVTAWGLKRGRGWARWTGVAASVVLLCGFPVLTPAGAVGIFVLLRHAPPKPENDSAEEFWSHNSRDSLALLVLSTCFFAGYCLAVPTIVRYALGLGLPPIDAGSFVHLEVLVAMPLLGTFVHELAHAAAALATGSRVLAISVGPATVRLDPRLPWSVAFDWKRMFEGGYMGAVPRSGRYARERQTLIVAAGPFASFLLSVALCFTFLNVPGTSWAPDWPFFAFGSALVLGITAVNLLPFGYTDGTMLWHLIAWTRQGQELVAIQLQAGYELQAALARADGDWDAELEFRRQALEAALQRGAPHPARAAAAYTALGVVQVNLGRLSEAETSFLAALSPPMHCPDNHRIVGVCWRMLHHMYALEHRVEDSRQAYAVALPALEKWKHGAGPGLERAYARLCLAELHLEARFLQRASEEMSAAIEEFRLGRKHPVLKATLCRVRAEAELSWSDIQNGLHAAGLAEQILRSGKIDQADYIPACQVLGDLGLSLWNCGRDDLALALLKDAAGLLEGRARKYWRLRYALVLAEAGRLEEAEAALPNEKEIPASLRRDFLGVRAAILVRSGRAPQAVTDREELLRMVSGEPRPRAGEVALVQNGLAHACLEAGRTAEAESFAQKAYEHLAAAGHPQSLAAAVTLARACWRKQQPAQLNIDEALTMMRDDTLTKPSEKARLLDTLAQRLEQDRRQEEAARLRLEAQEYWRRLRVPPTVEPTFRSDSEYSAAWAS